MSPGLWESRNNHRTKLFSRSRICLLQLTMYVGIHSANPLTQTLFCFQMLVFICFQHW